MIMLMKRGIDTIIAAIITMLLFTNVIVLADDVTVLTSGNCGYKGADVTYTLTSDGVFTVSGTGDMDYYYPDENEQPTMPWINYCDNIKEIVIEDGVKNVSYGGFVYCNYLTKVTLASSVTSLDPDCFFGCGLLTDINCENVAYVGEGAFAYCTVLNNVDFSKTTQICKNAFAHCYGLTDITLGEGLKTIGETAFYRCDKLESINIPSTVTSIELGAFGRCYKLDNVKLPYGITAISNQTFMECSALSNIEIPITVKTIGFASFALCPNIKNIELPEELTGIGQQAFFKCTALENIEIPESVTNISTGAFASCTSLNRIIIPYNVTVINANMFNGCTNLKSVEIPKNVTSIGSGVFAGCGNLSCVYLYEGSYADAFIAENNSSIQRKYITEDNAVAISDLDTANNTFTVLVDTDKLGGDPSIAGYLNEVNVLLDDTEQNVTNYRYSDDTQKYIAFDVQYINTSNAENTALRGEAVTLDTEDSSVFKYYVTSVLNIGMGGN